MRVLAVFLFLLVENAVSKLWPKGVVHYAINKKDYDVHSQDIIMGTLDQIQKEICVKFFNTPLNYSASERDRILYISNPDKKKACPPHNYNFHSIVVDMPIGYKCINRRDIARIVVSMLRASVEQPPAQTINSYDLLRSFQQQEEEQSTATTLLSPSDRNYINAQYHGECGELTQLAPVSRRLAGGGMRVADDNDGYYSDKLWPLGIVMYRVDENAPNLKSLTTDYEALKRAMRTIELASCVVFQESSDSDKLSPKNMIVFTNEQGEDMPNLGFTQGKQEVKLSSMVNGADGHHGHALNNLMRVLGIPMMSNRVDRDNYITINWNNVEKSKEHYLEKTPIEAWLRTAAGDDSRVPYDFDSVTHAPANYLCKDCSLGQQTVLPIQDHLWQRTLSMGHRTDLSPSDVEMLTLLYTKQCNNRLMAKNK